MSNEVTISDAVVETLRAYGVRRIFGVPGGGSSLQIIDAAARRGIDFVLARSETPAIIMAAVTGELSGRPGAALTTKGPGLANGTNGLAYASLDRAPTVILADGFDDAGLAYQSHQVFDQQALVAPLTKAQCRRPGEDAVAEVSALLDAALAYPQGPVYLEFTAAHGRKRAGAGGAAGRAPVVADPDVEALRRAQALLASKVRPVLVPGLQVVRDTACADAFMKLAERLQCPVYPTYKAKGVLPDEHPLVAGLYVGGAGEAPFIGTSDLIVLVGADPVEFALQPWRYPGVAVLDLTLHRYERHYMAPDVCVEGSLPVTLAALSASAAGSRWTLDEIADMREGLEAALRMPADRPITPQQVVEAAVRAAPANTRVSVDAGAHMVPTMAFWKARRPNDVLISNGLATMAFALPAAIAAALHEPERPVMAFTGDGGLAMCLGELATAAQYGCDITVVVFNDSALSLIGVKQASIGYAPNGVGFGETDFATAATGLGCLGIRCERLDDLEGAIRRGLARRGPAVVDVRVDPQGYLDQVKSLRG